MPDDLKELQNALQQIQQDPPHRRPLDWLIVLVRMTRLATLLGILILLGVAVSVIWPHAAQIRTATQDLLHPTPKPPVVAQAPSPATRNSLPPTPPSSPSLSTHHSQLSTAVSQPAHKIGDIFAIAAWEYSVTATAWRDSLKVADKTVYPDPGRKFLEIRLTICNTSDETAIVPPPRLVGPDGVSQDPTPKAGIDASIAGESLSPDRHFKRPIYFEVPAGKPYKLLLQGGWLSDKQALVEVSH